MKKLLYVLFILSILILPINSYSSGLGNSGGSGIVSTPSTGGGGGSGDNVSIDGVSVTDPNFISTGNIDFVDTSNTVTANINTNAVDDTHINWGEGASQISARDIPMAVISGSTFSTVQDLQNIFHSTGYVSGGNITDAGTATINVAAGTGLIRATDSSIAEILYFDWPVSNGLAITANSIRYIGVEYNAGIPQVVVRTLSNWNNQTDFQLGVVVNQAGTLFIGNIQHVVGDHATNMVQRSHEAMGIQRDNVGGGIVFGETGTRNITLTAGKLWDRLSEFTISALDTSVSGGLDIYSSTGLEASAATQWPNLQYDNAGTLTTLANNKWAVLWFYVTLDDKALIVYGTVEHNSMAAAEAELPPATLPNRIQAFGARASRLVFQKSAATASFTSLWDKPLSGSSSSDHGNLSGLADDDHDQYLLTDGTRALSGAWSMGGQAITNISLDANGTGNTITNLDEDNMLAGSDIIRSGIEFVIDGGGSTITTGIKGDIEIPFNCTIQRVTMLADVPGSIVVDLWVDTYANYPPTDADSITASAVPTITTALKSQDTTLTGWTTTLTAGSVIRYNVDSITTITRCLISLIIEK